MKTPWTEAAEWVARECHRFLPVTISEETRQALLATLPRVLAGVADSYRTFLREREFNRLREPTTGLTLREFQEEYHDL